MTNNKGWPNEPTRHALSSHGIRTSFDRDKQINKDDITDIIRRGHSYRNFRPEDFMEHALTEDGKLDEEKYIEARRVYNKMEDGRFNDMMDSVLRFFTALDEDEKDVWAEHNPELINWLGVHGFLQVLNTCEEYTGIPSYYEFRVVDNE